MKYSGSVAPGELLGTGDVETGCIPPGHSAPQSKVFHLPVSHNESSFLSPPVDPKPNLVPLSVNSYDAPCTISRMGRLRQTRG